MQFEVNWKKCFQRMLFINKSYNPIFDKIFESWNGSKNFNCFFKIKKIDQSHILKLFLESCLLEGEKVAIVLLKFLIKLGKKKKKLIFF